MSSPHALPRRWILSQSQPPLPLDILLTSVRNVCELRWILTKVGQLLGLLDFGVLPYRPHRTPRGEYILVIYLYYLTSED